MRSYAKKHLFLAAALILGVTFVIAKVEMAEGLGALLNEDE